VGRGRLVDPGPSLVAISREDARRIGINPLSADFRATVSTANGSVLVAPILLKEIKVGELSVRDVRAAVFPDNRLQVGLLGMSFLSKLSHFDVAGGRLVLKQSEGGVRSYQRWRPIDAHRAQP